MNEKQSIISNSDAELSDIIKSQPTETDVLTVKSSKETPNYWKLPPECNEYLDKKYRYRWVSKDKRQIVRARVKGWLICSRQNSPYLKPESFGVHGGYQNAMYPDHILAFMPLEKAQEIQHDVSDKSRSAVKHYTEDIKKDPRFYDAKIGGDTSDGSDDNPKGLVQGRDF